MKNASLLIAAALAANNIDLGMRPPVEYKKKEPTKPKFTDEELSYLAQLSGKEKKAYVKELKAKYSKG